MYQNSENKNNLIINFVVVGLSSRMVDRSMFFIPKYEK